MNKGCLRWKLSVGQMEKSNSARERKVLHFSFKSIIFVDVWKIAQPDLQLQQTSLIDNHHATDEPLHVLQIVSRR